MMVIVSERSPQKTSKAKRNFPSKFLTFICVKKGLEKNNRGGGEKKKNEIKCKIIKKR
jgi:hypothetical protein